MFFPKTGERYLNSVPAHQNRDSHEKEKVKPLFRVVSSGRRKPHYKEALPIKAKLQPVADDIIIILRTNRFITESGDQLFTSVHARPNIGGFAI